MVKGDFRCIKCQRVMNVRAMRFRLYKRTFCAVCPTCSKDLPREKGKKTMKNNTKQKKTLISLKFNATEAGLLAGLSRDLAKMLKNKCDCESCSKRNEASLFLINLKKNLDAEAKNAGWL